MDGEFGSGHRQGAFEARRGDSFERPKTRLVSQAKALCDRCVFAVRSRKSAIPLGRHLTNERTDAVAMNVLDPFEVAEIEVWPFFELQIKTPVEVKSTLDAAEYTVFQLALKNSTFGAVLNEAEIAPAGLIELPQSYRQCIIPDELFVQRKHPDIRIARRATTIASLARVISEREVSKGLRRTLTTQARRLERLATARFNELAGTQTPPEEIGPEG